MAKQGLNPRFNAQREVPTFGDVARQVHIELLPAWRNAKHGLQWLNTLCDYAFPKIGRMPIDSIGQPEVMMCLIPVWSEKHETAKRLAQRIKTVLDVARSIGLRSGENPVTAIKEAGALPKVKTRPVHHKAMQWQDVPEFYAALSTKTAMAAKALMFTCLTGARTGEVLRMRWAEIDWEAGVWTCPPDRMKAGEVHRVPLTETIIGILEPLRALESVLSSKERNATSRCRTCRC
ncbi:tyrosine-type recombinase/integrase [uncultured Tateyamaria sp.]|uniref:tyrosine-type recombinase/integrase n=1 Tax=uncultured Tateyamaria sp. TaxID=455651 RepID=UPI00261C29E5|nr:tyrosine-type recombinase/integrase [uncultured Tateyamaria sp.]